MSQNTNPICPLKVHAWSAWSSNYRDFQTWQQWANSEAISPELEPHSDETILPSVSFVPLAHRKKLSVHTKLTLYLLYDLGNRPETNLAETSSLELIVASRFGEASTTTQLLDALATNSPSSPMTFSRSVLNSAAGLHSIITGNTRTHVAVSAIEDTFRSGLYEAIIRANTTGSKVIFVWADDVIPHYFRKFANYPPCPTGLALLLSSEGSLQNFHLEESINENPFSILRHQESVAK